MPVNLGSGMNLLDIETKEWWQAALDVSITMLNSVSHILQLHPHLYTHTHTHKASAPNLKEKLGAAVPSKTVVVREDCVQ